MLHPVTKQQRLAVGLFFAISSITSIWILWLVIAHAQGWVKWLLVGIVVGLWGFLYHKILTRILRKPPKPN